LSFISDHQLVSDNKEIFLLYRSIPKESERLELLSGEYGHKTKQMGEPKRLTKVLPATEK